MARLTECPGAERLAAFVEGRLEPRSRSDVTEHLAACADCRDVVADVAAIRAPARRRTPLSVLAAAAAAVLVFVAGAVWWVLRPEAPSRASLARIVEGQRILEPRLSGPFTHAPWRGRLRGADPLPPAIEEAMRLRLASLRGDLERSADPATRGEIGATLLLLGQTDDAIESLEAAANADPDDADRANDVAAAYLTRGDALSAVAALDWSARALALRPEHAEAAFNRALARGRIFAADSDGGDPQPVIDAWDHYLAIDDDSPWADEARTAIEALRRERPEVSYTPKLDGPGAERALAAYRTAEERIAAGQLDEALRIANETLETTDETCCPDVRGILHWTVGYVHGLKGRHASGIRAYRESLDRFESAGNVRRAAQVRMRLAELHELSNERARAWELRLAAFASHGWLPPEERHGALIHATYACRWSDRPYAAMDLLDVARAVTARPGERSELLTLQAHVSHAVGLDDEALEHATAAIAAAEEVDDGTLQARYLTEATLAYATAAAGRDAETTSRYLDRAIRHFEDAGQPARLAELYAERWQLNHSLDGIEHPGDFDRALELVRASRRDFPDRVGQARFFARAGRIVERELARMPDAEHERAFALVERLRAEQFGGSIPAEPRTFDYATTLAELGEGDTLFYFARAEDRWRAWSFRFGEDAPRRFSVPRALLDDVDLEAALPDTTRRRLFERLLGEGHVAWAEATRLLVVADGALADVPFAELVEPASGKRVNDRVVVVRLLAATPLGETDRGAEIDRVALLGSWDPAGDHPQLPAVRESLQDLRAEWSDRVGSWSTSVDRERFEAAFEDSDLLHFAGHAVFDPEHPARSGLIVSDPERPLISVEDLDGRDGSAPGIVVLAACRSAGLSHASTAGSVGLVPALLSRGVGHVIATSRAVRDRDAQEFVLDLHRRLAAGTNIEQAFRETRDNVGKIVDNDSGSWVLYASRS